MHTALMVDAVRLSQKAAALGEDGLTGPGHSPMVHLAVFGAGRFGCVHADAAVSLAAGATDGAVALSIQT